MQVFLLNPGRVAACTYTVMSEGFQIITHTAEQTAQWTRLIAANPARVLNVMALQPGQRNRHGDNSADIYPAMAAVKEASREGGKWWIGLVKAGIAETLCRNVEELCTFVHTLPNMPEHLKKEALISVRILLYMNHNS